MPTRPTEPNSSGPTERTRLLPGADVIRREFEDALQEEDSGASLFEALVKRPLAVVIAISLFALVIIATTLVSGLTSPEFVNRAAEVPQLVPVSASLMQVSTDNIAAAATVNVTMDYAVLGDAALPSFVRAVASKLQRISVKFDREVQLRSHTFTDTDAWEHLAFMRIADPLNVSIVPGSQFQLSIETLISDIGRPDVVGLIVEHALRNEPITVKAEGVIVGSKWGLQWRTPFSLVKTFTLPKQATDELADLSQIIVSQTAANEVNVTAHANTIIGDFPISGVVPELGWIVKMPGCDPTRHEILCEGFNAPIRISDDDAEVGAWFSAFMARIPPHLSEPCDPTNEESKSPIDRWLSGYLAGRLSTFYIEGDGRSDKRILNQLLTGYDIPFSVFGKPASEKLISSITIEDAGFEGQNGLVPQDEWRFNGKALVNVTLPRFMTIDQSTVVVVIGVKGVIQLFREDGGEHFAQILAHEWILAVTLANKQGYKITCFFDGIPMTVTNTQVFAMVSRAMVLEGHAPVRYDAVVDVLVETPAGQFAVRKVRVKGETDMRA